MLFLKNEKRRYSEVTHTELFFLLTYYYLHPNVHITVGQKWLLVEQSCAGGGGGGRGGGGPPAQTPRRVL